MHPVWIRLSLWLLSALAALNVQAASQSSNNERLHQAPRIVIILDDLGYNRPSGERALQLPGNITYAIIPFTPYSELFANEAHARNREVMLHMPMQSSDPDRKLDDGGLTQALSEAEIRDRINRAIQSVPHIVGMNNHMGSNITTEVNIMHWLMQELQHTPLFFVDSMTNPLSVAHRSAHNYNIPSLKRDVFLDNIQTEQAVERQFHKLLNLAKKRGYAIAIGHPYPATLSYLEKALPALQNEGVELVDASDLVLTLGRTFNQPLDIDDLMHWIIAMPAPESLRLNFTNEGLY